jgi:hypothetical protein
LKGRTLGLTLRSRFGIVLYSFSIILLELNKSNESAVRIETGVVLGPRKGAGGASRGGLIMVGLFNVEKKSKL